ncbi:MAG: hypothetical protein L7F78_12375 [Syntrophales bacterium LBB04]|nr:hypothetical protein [Syntrophales bacterium LBB04]
MVLIGLNGSGKTTLSVPQRPAFAGGRVRFRGRHGHAQHYARDPAPGRHGLPGSDSQIAGMTVEKTGFRPGYAFPLQIRRLVVKRWRMGPSGSRGGYPCACQAGKSGSWPSPGSWS